MLSPDWEDIKTFLEVSRNRTVRGAAKVLKVHHSTVSRRIERLETSLGVRLFDRRPEGYLLTPAGENLVGVAMDFQEDLLSTERQIAGRDEVLVGAITVTMPEPLAVNAFEPRLREFTDAYPDLELKLITTMDFLDVARREADIAIRMDNNPPQTLVGKRLFRYKETVYASRDYLSALKRRNDPSTARWLGWLEDEGPYPDWTQSTEFANAPIWGFFPDLAIQQMAARQGLGLTMLPCLIGDSDPSLVRATTRPPTESREIWILTHADLRRTARVRAFMSFAESVMRDIKPRVMGDLAKQSGV